MKPLYYVAHPFGGDAENKKKIEQIIIELMTEFPDKDFLSPIHASDFAYNLIPYVEGMDWCLNVLDRCDALILCDCWETSKGCLMEYAYAIAKDKPIFMFDKKNKMKQL